MHPCPKNHCTINIILTNIEQYHLLPHYFAQNFDDADMFY